MRTVYYKAKAGRKQRKGFKAFRRAFRLEGQNKIQVIGFQSFQEFFRSGKTDIHLDLRIGFRKHSQCGYQQGTHAISHPDVEHPCLYPFQVADNLFPVFRIIKSLCRIRQKSQSGFRRDYPLPYTVEKQDVQFILQLLNLLGKCTLRDKQRTCRLRKILQFAGRFKIFQLTEFHFLSFLPMNVIGKMSATNIENIWLAFNFVKK